MNARRFAIVAVVALFAAVCFGLANAQAAVQFSFDPVDFFNYKPVSDGFSTDGGMFKLHQTWGVDMYRSWNVDQRPVVDAWAAGLGENQGIACFNIWLADQANAPLWGETLVSSGSVAPTGSAPNGWTATVIGNPWPDGGNGTWLVQWSTDDPTKYIRPGNDVGEFGFTFEPTTVIDPNAQYTIWFGGANPGAGSESTQQALYYTGVGNASGFEATLGLTPVPEPATLIVWSLLGASSWLGMRVVRQGRRIGRQSWSPEARNAILEIIERGRHS